MAGPALPASANAELYANLGQLLQKKNSLQARGMQDKYLRAFGGSDQALNANLLGLVFEFEFKYADAYGGDSIAMLQLAQVRRELRVVLRRYGERTARLLAEPTKGWNNPPDVHIGVDGGSTMYGMLDTDTGDMATGAYVQATELHSLDPDKEGKNEAAWHYIWTNNGVNVTNPDKQITPRPGRVSKSRVKRGARPALVFGVPYISATEPGSLLGGTAMVGETVETSYSVPHMVRPRNWVGQVVKLLQPEFNVAVMSAVIRGIDKYSAQIADSHKWKNQ
jgi:hypothetical protein